MSLATSKRPTSHRCPPDELWKPIGSGHDEAWQYGFISGKLSALRFRQARWSNGWRAIAQPRLECVAFPWSVCRSCDGSRRRSK